MISSSTTMALVMSDVRCVDCGKLIVKWHRSGTAVIEYKCPRCGGIARLMLST